MTKFNQRVIKEIAQQLVVGLPDREDLEELHDSMVEHYADTIYSFISSTKEAVQSGISPEDLYLKIVPFVERLNLCEIICNDLASLSNKDKDEDGDESNIDSLIES